MFKHIVVGCDGSPEGRDAVALGAAIEALGQARTVLFDKTGTLTVGTPEVREVLSADGVAPGELLRLAASVDRFSAHVLGEALVRAASQASLRLSVPEKVREEPRSGDPRHRRRTHRWRGQPRVSQGPRDPHRGDRVGGAPERPRLR